MKEWKVVEIKGRPEKVNPATAVAQIMDDESEDKLSIRLDDPENLPFWMEIYLERKPKED